MSYWYPSGIFPAHIVYSPSKKDWKGFLKANLGLKEDYPKAHGHLTHFCKEGRDSFFVLTFNRKVLKKKSREQVVGIVVHEVNHAIRLMFEDIGEKDPGLETEAYLHQDLTQWLLNAFEQEGLWE